MIVDGLFRVEFESSLDHIQHFERMASGGSFSFDKRVYRAAIEQAVFALPSCEAVTAQQYFSRKLGHVDPDHPTLNTPKSSRHDVIYQHC
jgi:hypothetical protein